MTDVTKMTDVTRKTEIRHMTDATPMTDAAPGAQSSSDVAVIGGGPAGLAAATELKRRGVASVVVLERESQAGGIPRHCGHPPFGMREFKRVLTGPHYARKLVDTAVAAGVDLRTSTTVVEARPAGRLLITSNAGLEEINARRVIYATGARETPRAAKFISGQRPLGVINTGALQAMVYIQNQKPFERPVIIGTELVSFSSIWTCRRAGMAPVAMIEDVERITAHWPYSLLPRLMDIPFTFAMGMVPRLMGVPLHLRTRLVSIAGDAQVNSVRVETAIGLQRDIECDGVILTGQFTPEASLARCGHLEVDRATGGPVVDQFGRCSDPAYFAAGNLLRPVETAGWSWNEGRQTGCWVADDLAGRLAAPQAELKITTGGAINYTMPQKIALPFDGQGMENLQLRFSRAASGDLVAANGKTVVFRKPVNVQREQRFLLPTKDLVACANKQDLKLTLEEDQS